MGRDSVLFRVVAAVALVLAGWVGWQRWGVAAAPAPGPADVRLGDGPGSTVETGAWAGGEPDEPPPSSTPPTIVVHVAGAVGRPGIYELAGSARVHEAVAAAGGAVAGGDPHRLNLAAGLSDGQRVYVPREDEPFSPDDGAGGLPPAVVSVNRATARELESLPGIGPVLAGRIVADRAAHGPFQTVDELERVTGIGPKLLEQLRPHVRP